MKIKVRTGLESPWDECYLQTSRALHFNERYFTWCVYFYPTTNWDKRDGYIQWATVIPDLKNYILECQCCHNGLNPDFTVFLYGSAKECLNNLHQKPDIICLDFGLPDMTGDILLKRIKEINNSIPIIFNSSC